AQKRTAMMFGAGPNERDVPGSQLNGDLQLQMSVGGDGLVRQVSVTFQQGDTGSPAVDGDYIWSVTYSQLGSTPPITAPPRSIDVPSGTLPPGAWPQNIRPQNTQPHDTQAAGPKITPAEQAAYLRAAACIRSHGVPDFPDPTFQNGHVKFNIPL